jgi:cell division protein FtsB
VRWDRLGHIAMLLVLGALLYLYLSAGIRILSTWQQERKGNAAVAALEREHRQLVSQREALRRQGTVEVEARALNMMRTGEQPYIVSGLPND